MDDVSLDTIRLHRFVERWQGGDRAAADDLLRSVGDRLEVLTRKLLRGYPTVQQWAETADVFQCSLMRLLESLRKVRPESTRHFFNLAAMQIRRELIDLARRFRGRPALAAIEPEASAGPSPSPTRGRDDDFDLWCRFHEAVEQLPTDEREVVSLIFYHGWTQLQVAGLLQVDERTVRRKWHAACLRLNELVGGELPAAVTSDPRPT